MMARLGLCDGYVIGGIRTTITYKRVKNLGNYETETLEVSTTVSDDMNLDIAIALLRDKVLNHLDLLEDEKETTDSNTFLEGTDF
jgi:hypothetical protein